MKNNTLTNSSTDILSMVMRQVYLRMFVALLASAFTAMFLAANPTIFTTIFDHRILFVSILIAEVALVIGLSATIDRLSNTMASLMFLLYAILNGITLSCIFFIYTLGSIAYTFFIAAGVYLAMSIYGFVTKNNLNTFGSYCIMGLLGIIIASVVNIFIASDTMQWIISFLGVAIFMGLTAWDTQKIKQAAFYADPSQVNRLAVIGALSLYLDFINIFLYLLRFFGKRN